MNTGREIVAEIILRGRDLQPYIDAGLTEGWLNDRESRSEMVFDRQDLRAYRRILEHFGEHGAVMTGDLFRRCEPAVSYPLPDSDYKPSELIEAAQSDVRSGIVSVLVEELVDAYDESDFDSVQEQLAKTLDKLQTGIRNSGEAEALLLEGMTLDELDDSGVKFKIDGMMHETGVVMLSAAAETGKSTLVWNMLARIFEGDEFLGRKTVYEGGRIDYFAFEMDQALIKEYATDAGVQSCDDLRVHPMKGRVDSFNIMDPAVRSMLAKALAGVEILILDPIGPLLGALHLDENSNPDVSRFREACEALIREAGIKVLFLVHHTGRADKGRSRGASVFDDWPDAIWTYTMPKDDHPVRELVATGRKISGTFTVKETAPGSGQVESYDAEEALEYRSNIILAMRRDGKDGYGTNEVKKLIGGKSVKVGIALHEAAKEGVLTMEQRGQKKIWRLAS